MLKKGKYEIIEGYDKEEITGILKNFDNSGIKVADGERNKIKKFRIVKNGHEKELNVKKFKKKGFLTRLIYRIRNGSKAERSYRYAVKLLEKGIETPEPIAFFDELYVDDEKTERSFYVCENIDYDFTCRELLWDDDMPERIKVEIEKNRDEIIRGFAGYTFRLHENGVKFDDYSPGNVLIKKIDEGDYRFYLIDLNRMSFHKKLGFRKRMKNMSRMMENRKYIGKFTLEYSRLYKEKSYNEIFIMLYYYTRKHKYKDKIHNIRRSVKKLFKRKKQ